MNKSQKKLKFLAECAIIAALYVVGTYASEALGLAYGAIQFRISEALCALTVFTPAAIPGLTIGCMIGNLSSPLGIWDIIFGPLATLLAALCARALRKVQFKKLPVLSCFMPVIFNAVIVGLELAILIPSEHTKLIAFFIAAGQVAVGELVVCVALGLPLFSALKRTKLFPEIKK